MLLRRRPRGAVLLDSAAETDRAQWAGTHEGGYDVAVRVRGVREDGTVVIRGVIDLWVTPRR